MSPKPGICTFCGCSEFDACVVDGLFEHAPCYWIDYSRTVCSACAPAAKAEAHALKAHVGIHNPALERSYHQGFVVGWFGISRRSLFSRNPYPLKQDVSHLHHAWNRGQLAGVEASRQYQLTCGRIENAPRKVWLRDNRPVPQRRRA